MSALLVVSLATSLDRYLWLDSFEQGKITRPTRVLEQAGGKALHVAQAAAALGAKVDVIGLVGGGSGQTVRELADHQRWAATWIDARAATRVCTCIVDASAHSMTELYEPLAEVAADTWPQVIDAVTTALAHQPAALMLSGRIPAGLPTDAFAQLSARAEAAHVPSYLDAAGSSLAAALSTPPTVLKVNQAEAADLIGDEVNTEKLAIRAARTLSERVDVAIITRGADGAIYADADGHVAAVDVPAVDRPYPVGSGDAFLAGFALARSIHNLPWERSVHVAAAASVVNAARVVAADVDCGAVTDAVPTITVRAASY